MLLIGSLAGLSRHLPQGRCGLKSKGMDVCGRMWKSPSARKVWIDKVNEYFEYCVTFCKWIQFHRFDKEAPPPFRGDFAMQLEIISIFLSVFCYKNQMNHQQILIVSSMLINNFEETDKLPVAVEEEMTYGKK